MNKPEFVEKILAAYGAKNDKQKLTDFLMERVRALQEGMGESDVPVDIMLKLLLANGKKSAVINKSRLPN